jgi:hypothetical protein
VKRGVRTRKVRVTSPRLPSPDAVAPMNVTSVGFERAQTAMPLITSVATSVASTPSRPALSRGRLNP